MIPKCSIYNCPESANFDLKMGGDHLGICKGHGGTARYLADEFGMLARDLFIQYRDKILNLDNPNKPMQDDKPKTGKKLEP